MSRKAEQNQIALLYHANLNHFSLSPYGRDALARQYMSDMLEHIQVPVAVSLPAEDLLYLYLHYPETYSDLINHPHITFLLSTYAHAISNYDFGVYPQQVELGKKVLNLLIPEEKLLQTGYPSEVDVPKKADRLLLNSLWDQIILGDTRVFPKQDKDHFLWDLDSDLHFPAILSRRENMYRDIFHKFFRLEASAGAVVQALEQDAHQWSNNIGYLARIDLEAPLFNEIIYPDGSSTGPRIDLWQALNAAYAKSPELFISMTEFLDRMGSQNLDIVKITHDTAEDPKWQFNTYEQEIKSLGESGFDNLVGWYTWLSTHHSDYFCTEKDDWIFQTGDGGTIKIVKQQMYREPELQAKLELLQGMTYSGDNRLIGDYIARMQTVYQYLAEGHHEFTT